MINFFREQSEKKMSGGHFEQSASLPCRQTGLPH